MAYTADQATALTNEARLRAAQVSEAKVKGLIEALGQQASAISVQQSDAQARLAVAVAERTALEQQAGAGITDTFGPYSTLEQAARTERFAGKDAAIDFVKANPDCTEAEAVAAYTQAALTARPADRQWLLYDPTTMRQEHSANLVALGMILDTTWESWRAWVVATEKAVIMGPLWEPA